MLLVFDQLISSECSYQDRRVNQRRDHVRGHQEKDSFSVGDPHDDMNSMTSHPENEDYVEKAARDEYEDDKTATQDEDSIDAEASEQVDQQDRTSDDQRSRSHQEGDQDFGLRMKPSNTSTSRFRKNLSTGASFYSSVNKTSAKFSLLQDMPIKPSMISSKAKKKKTSSFRDYDSVVIKPPYDDLYSNPNGDRYRRFPAEEDADQPNKSIQTTPMSTTTLSPETFSPTLFSSLQTHVRKMTRKDKLTPNQDLIHSHQRIVRNKTTASVQIILPKESEFDQDKDARAFGTENERSDFLQDLRTDDETPRHQYFDQHDVNQRNKKNVIDSSWEIPSASMTSYSRVGLPPEELDSYDTLGAKKWFNIKRNKMTNHKKISVVNHQQTPQDLDHHDKGNQRSKVVILSKKNLRTDFPITEEKNSLRDPKVRLVLNQTSVITLLKSLTKVTSAKIKRTKEKKFRRVKLQDIILPKKIQKPGKHSFRGSEHNSMGTKQQQRQKWRREYISRRLDVNDYVVD
jgi:hypothetical protein